MKFFRGQGNKSDLRHQIALLCKCAQRPSCRNCSKQYDELAPPHVNSAEYSPKVERRIFVAALLYTPGPACRRRSRLVSSPISFPVTTSRVRKAGQSGRICDCLFETLKSLRFSYAAFDFVYSPCVLVSRRLQPHASHPSPRPSIASCGQRVEQRLRLLQVDRIKPFSKPTIYRSKKSPSFLPHPLIVPKSRHAHRCTQLPRLRLLRVRNRERALEICSRLRRTQLRQLERDFAGYAMDFRLVPAFPCCFHRGHRLANAAPSLLK